MADSRLYLSDMGGFPRAGEPILLSHDGNVCIGIDWTSLRNLQIGHVDQAIFYNSVVDGGVRIITRNSATGTSSYCGFSTYTDAGYSGFLHSTTSGYNQGAIAYVASTTYVGSVQSGGLHLIAGNAAGIMRFSTGGEGTSNERMRIIAAGQVGIFGSAAAFTPTAYLHLAAGTTAANTAPLKFTSGSLLSSPTAGAMEFLTDKAYITITTGAARKEYTLNDGTLTSGRVPFATTNGRLTDASTLTYSTGALNNNNTANAACEVINNAANNTGAYGKFQLQNGGTETGFLSGTGSSWTASGIFLASQANFGGALANGLNLIATHGSGMIRLVTGGTATSNERAQIDAAGNIRLCGTGALATNATDGFVYMPSSAGAPTGTPTSVTGGVATEIDTTNSKFMAYIGGAWKGVTLA